MVAGWHWKLDHHTDMCVSVNDFGEQFYVVSSKWQSQTRGNSLLPPFKWTFYG